MRSLEADPMQAVARVYPTAVAPDLSTVFLEASARKIATWVTAMTNMKRRPRPRDVVNCQLVTGNDRVERVAFSALRKCSLADISVGARSGAPESDGRRHRSCGKWPSDDPSPSAQ